MCDSRWAPHSGRDDTTRRTGTDSKIFLMSVFAAGHTQEAICQANHVPTGDCRQLFVSAGCRTRSFRLQEWALIRNNDNRQA